MTPSPLTAVVRAEILAGIASAARQVGRFDVRIKPQIRAEDADRAYWEVAGPIVAAARSCRLFLRPRQKRRGSPGSRTRQTWPQGYTSQQRGRVELDLSAPGIQDHQQFWWQLVYHEL